MPVRPLFFRFKAASAAISRLKAVNAATIRLNSVNATIFPVKGCYRRDLSDKSR